NAAALPETAASLARHRSRRPLLSGHRPGFLRVLHSEWGCPGRSVQFPRISVLSPIVAPACRSSCPFFSIYFILCDRYKPKSIVLLNFPAFPTLQIEAKVSTQSILPLKFSPH